VTAFARLDELAPLRVWDGVVGRALEGERVTFAVLELAPGTVVPEHAHEAEQVGVLVRGSLRFRVGGEERWLEAGDGWRIPSGAPHEVVTGPEGAVAVEAFAPARADWARLERADPSPAAWPVRSGRLSKARRTIARMDN
jgi:quercetin dioxygenase-like cupin family protein